MSAPSEATSVSGGHAAVMLGFGLLVMVALIGLVAAWPFLVGVWRRVVEAHRFYELDLDAQIRRDLSEAAERSQAGRGTWVG